MQDVLNVTCRLSLFALVCHASDIIDLYGNAQMNLMRRRRVDHHGDDALASGQQRAPMMMKK